ncbi:recombination protein NinG [Aquimarina algiphila]|uniref:recombination protein NinG n=1 Tax=Aquimarina algiphila TaxID=2047982 RepID=UPI001431BEC5|nr:recombination protein NinG [Aquimarina algiphila]
MGAIVIQKYKDKTIPQLLKEARKVCHAYIKARDRQGNYATCISCQNTFLADIMQAGHYFKSELYSCVRFNELNINLQCEHCNCFEEGNLVMYEPNLINKIGIEAFTDLQDTVEAYRRSFFKWDRSSLIDIIDYYSTKLKEVS